MEIAPVTVVEAGLLSTASGTVKLGRNVTSVSWCVLLVNGANEHAFRFETLMENFTTGPSETKSVMPLRSLEVLLVKERLVCVSPLACCR